MGPPQSDVVLHATGPGTPANATRQGSRQRDDLARRGTQAHAALALIDGALACDHDDVAACSHFQALLTDHVNVRARCPTDPQLA